MEKHREKVNPVSGHIAEQSRVKPRKREAPTDDFQTEVCLSGLFNRQLTCVIHSDNCVNRERNILRAGMQASQLCKALGRYGTRLRESARGHFVQSEQDGLIVLAFLQLADARFKFGNAFDFRGLALEFGLQLCGRRFFQRQILSKQDKNHGENDKHSDDDIESG